MTVFFLFFHFSVRFAKNFCIFGGEVQIMQRKALLSALPLSAISLAGTALLALTISLSACVSGGGSKPDDDPSSSSAAPYDPPKDDTTAAISLEGFNVAQNSIDIDRIDINGSVEAKLSTYSPINKDSILRLGTTIRKITFGSKPGGVKFVTKEELKDNELVYSDSAKAPTSINLKTDLEAHIDLTDESLDCGTYEVFVTVSAWEDKAGKINKPITKTGEFTKDESYCPESSSSEEVSSSSAQTWTFGEPVDKIIKISGGVATIDLDEEEDGEDMIVTISDSKDNGLFTNDATVSSGRSNKALRIANIRKASDVQPNKPIDLHFEENAAGKATDELETGLLNAGRYVYVIATSGAKYLVLYMPGEGSTDEITMLGQNKLPIRVWKEIE
jgi:hypothetical protein